MSTKYTKEFLAPIVAESFSTSEVVIKIRGKCAGGSHTHVSRLIRQYQLDTSHFEYKTHRFQPDVQKKPKELILVHRPNDTRRSSAKMLKRALLESGVNYICSECGLKPEWNGKKLSLQIDHINADWLDDRIDNLRFLCPNCHCQTATYGNCKPKIPKIRKQRKTRRPDRLDLEKRLWVMPSEEIAKHYGVSGVAVAKWCKYYGLSKPPRGYWTKQKNIPMTQGAGAIS